MIFIVNCLWYLKIIFQFNLYLLIKFILVKSIFRHFKMRQTTLLLYLNNINKYKYLYQSKDNYSNLIYNQFYGFYHSFQPFLIIIYIFYFPLYPQPINSTYL